MKIIANYHYCNSPNTNRIVSLHFLSSERQHSWHTIFYIILLILLYYNFLCQKYQSRLKAQNAINGVNCLLERIYPTNNYKSYSTICNLLRPWTQWKGGVIWAFISITHPKNNKQSSTICVFLILRVIIIIINVIKCLLQNQIQNESLFFRQTIEYSFRHQDGFFNHIKHIPYQLR